MVQSGPSLVEPQPVGQRVVQALVGLRKATLAISDQLLFSGANFLLNIALARWLHGEGYGAYSLAFAVFLLFSNLHTAILIEPMSIFGAGKYADCFARYLRRVLSLHIQLMIPTSALLLGVAGILGWIYAAAVGWAFLGLVLSAGLILLMWIVRRIGYLQGDLKHCVRGSLIYCLAVIAFTGAFQIAGLLDPMTAFLIMGLASGISSAVQLWRFRPIWHSGPGPSLSEMTREHWRYGKWAIAASALSWIPAQIYYMILPATLGLEATGALRALTNFATPVLQGITALNLLLLPTLVRNRISGGKRKMNRTMWTYFALFCAGCGVYMGFLWLFRAHVFQIAYGGKYLEYSGLPFILAAALPLGTCITAVLGNALRAIERPDRIFWCYIGSTAVSIMPGIPMVRRFGLSGALLGIHLSSLLLGIAMWIFYNRERTV